MKKKAKIEKVYRYRGYHITFVYDPNSRDQPKFEGEWRWENTWFSIWGHTMNEAREHFREDVDLYLKDCAKAGEKPAPADEEVV